MKKLLSFIAILLTLLLTFSSCAGCNQKPNETDAPTTPVETTAEPDQEPSKEPATDPTEPGVVIDQDFVDKAADMIYEFYKPGKSNTVSADFTLPSKVKYQGEDVEVKWVVSDGTEYAEIGESDYENLINVIVNKSSTGGPFKLKGIVSAGGYTKEIEFDYVLVSQYDLLAKAYALQPGENIENSTLTGVISKVNTPFDPAYNNVTVTIIVDGHDDMPIMCYRLKGDGADTIKVGDTITVFGTLTNYNGTIEFTTGCTLVSIDNVGEEIPDDSPVFNSDREIVEAAYKLPGGEMLSSTKTYTLTGKVTKVNTPYDDNYKNVTVTIVVDNMNDKPIQCYRMKGTDADKVKVTDVIQVTGYLKNYVNSSGKSTIEFDAGCTLDKIVEVGSGEPRVNYGTEAQIVDAAYALAGGDNLVGEQTLTGKVTKVNTPYDPGYKNVTVTIVVSGREDKPIQCYRMKGADADKVKQGDTIKVTGILKNYVNQEGKSTIEFDAGCILDQILKSAAVIDYGTDAQEVDAAYALPAGESLSGNQTLTGVVTKINTPYDDGYKNVTVTIVVAGKTDKPVMCYRMKGDQASIVKVTDTIQVTGTLTNYNGTIEFGSGCTLDKIVTSGSGEPTVDYGTDAQEVDAAYALQPGDSLTGTQTLTGKVTKINTPYDDGYKNVTVTIVVTGKEDKPIQCFRMKGTDASKVKVGDVIQVTGTLKNYQNKDGVSTIEFDAGCTLDKIVTEGEGEPSVDYGTDAQEVDAAYALEPGKALQGTQTLTGKVTEVNTPYSDQYKNVTVTIVVTGKEDKPIQCYRMKGTDADKVKAGDVIQVTGTLKNYVDKDGKSTIEFDAGCTLDKIVTEGEGGEEPPATGEDKVQNKTYTVDELLAAMAQYTADQTSAVECTVVGVATSSSYNSKYDSYTVWLQSDDGKTANAFELYSVGLDKSLQAEYKGKSLKGMTITCTGYVKLYNGTYEMPFLGAKSSPTKEDYTPTITKIEGSATPEPTGEDKVEAKEYTVDGLLAAMKEYKDKQVSNVECTVTGVATSSTYNSKYDSYTVWLQSDDGKTAQAVQIYSGKLDASIKEDYTAKDAMKGKTVTVKGYAKLYGSTYEISYLKADESPTEAEVSPLILKVGETEVTDDMKLAATLEEISVPAEINEAGKVTLPKKGTKYPEVAIAWTMDPASSEYAVLGDGSIEFKLPETAPANVKLTAKLTIQGSSASQTKEFPVTINQSVTDQAQVDKEAAALDDLLSDAEYNTDKTLTLPVAGATYTKVAINWTLDPSNSEYAVLADAEGGKSLALKIPDSELAVKVKAEITLNSAKATKEYTLTLKKLSTKALLDKIKAELLKDGDKLDGEYTLTGVITEFSYYFRNTGSVSFLIDVLDEEGKSLTSQYPEFLPFLCFTVEIGEISTLAFKDTVSVTGSIVNYQGKIEFTSGGTVSDIKKGAPTPAEIVELIKSQNGEDNKYNYGAGYISLNGLVKTVPDKNGTFTFTVIDEEGKSLDFDLTVEKGKYEGTDPLEEGDTVKVTGIEGTKSKKSGDSYVYSKQFMSGSKVELVKKHELSDAEKLAEELKALAEKYTDKVLTDVGAKVELPLKGTTFEEVGIAWAVNPATSDYASLNEAGDTFEVKAIPVDANAEFTLTGTLSIKDSTEEAKTHSFKVTVMRVSDEDKLAAEAAELDKSFSDREIFAPETITLPLKGKTFENVVIAWTLDPAGSEYAVLSEDGATLTVKIPEEALTVKATATLSIEGSEAKATKVYTYTLRQPTVKELLEYVNTLEEGTVLEGTYTLTGVISQISQYYKNTGTSFYMSVLDETETDLEMPVFCELIKDVAADPDKNIEANTDASHITIFDTVTVTGTLQKAGDGPKFTQSSLVIEKKNTLTYEEIIEKVKAQDATHHVGYICLYGTVDEVTDPYTTQFKNVTFNMGIIDEAGKDQDLSVIAFRVNGGAAETLKKGDIVSVTGVMGYYGTSAPREFMQNSEAEFAEVTFAADEDKVHYEEKFLEIPKSFNEAGTYKLPTPKLFTDVQITWNSSDKKYANIIDGDLVIVLPEDADVKLTITATLSLNDVAPVKQDFVITIMKAVNEEEGIPTVISINVSQLSPYGETTDLNGKTLEVENINLAFEKKSGQTTPSYYTDGTFRCYKSNVLTLSEKEGLQIIKIVFTFASNAGEFTVDVGSYDQATNTWTGNSSSVAFTVASGQRRVKTIEITYLKVE